MTLPLVKAAAIEFPDGSELLKYGYVTTVFRNYYGMTSVSYTHLDVYKRQTLGTYSSSRM